ncbi:MAG TPA: amidohydrolase [Syntrophorhabdaceae bacterium]|nr:amidohydrolase [Syntrophorhabdaceae bacterium]
MKILIKDVLLGETTTNIFINNGLIEEIDPGCMRRADKVINGRNKAALPSLINGHTHAAMTLFRGYADDMPLKRWLEEKIWPLEAKLTEEDVYWGAKLACLEMIKNGITSFNDMYWHWEATAQAACDMGIRGFVSAVFIDMFDEKKSDEQLEENTRLFELSDKYRPNVTFTFGPHAIYTVSKKSLEWMRDFSKQRDILIHMHLMETQQEIDFSIQKYGVTPVEFLRDIDLLSDRYIGCHGCMLTASDASILKKTDAKLVHVPVSNLKLSVDSIFPHTLMESNDIPYCFGTDGCASNNHLDLIETMKFSSLLAKFLSHDPTMLPARRTFDLATGIAARIFHLGEWQIEVGKSPDIVLVDIAGPEFVPNFDIYSDIVYASNGSIVDTVICMGEVIMEERYIAAEEEIKAKVKTLARALVTR